jgi:hypothetical protein
MTQKNTAVTAHCDVQELISDVAAAAILGVKPETLANWRYLKSVSLPYVKVGRLVKYKRSQLQAFIEHNTVAG